MSYIREFELRAYENRLKKFETLIYLCLGQESIYGAISEALPKLIHLVNTEAMVFILQMEEIQKIS